jgi:septal ring-binding cell division protein DamX
MELTIKIIRGIATTNLIILGLAACSSSPAPWTQTEESPWEAKYAAESQNVPPDSAVTDSSLNDPVLLADPEPEPIVMQEPEAAPAPEVIAPVVVQDLTPEQEIMATPSGSYAVQVYASKTTASVEKFKDDKGLENLMTVKTDRSGSIVYVLVDVHPDRASANVAAEQLEIKIGSKPWVRSIAGLQKIVAE